MLSMIPSYTLRQLGLGIMFELTEKLNSLQHRSPKIYLGVVSASAILGVGILLLLPIISISFVLSSLNILYGVIFSQTQELIALSALLYQLPIAALFAFLSYQFITLSLAIPYRSEIYVSINKKKTPQLIALIEELEHHFNIEQIDNILLTDQYDISVHVTPHFGFPPFAETTLQIGLPLMQTVSAKQFKALLARRIGQLRFKINKLTNKITFFNDIVSQYVVACQENAHWSYKPFYYYLKTFQAFFSAISFYAIRMDELKNDEYAIDIIDGKSFAQSLGQVIIASHYLKNTYWVSMYKLQRQYPHKSIFPHANMTVSFTQSIVQAESQQLIEQQFNQLSNFQNPTPILRTRLKKLGHDNFSNPLPLEDTAAIFYLDSALPRVTKIFDQLWLQKRQAQRELTTAVNSNEQRLNVLVNKVSEQALTAAETWELAVLTEKLKGYHAAIPIYKKIIERNPMHAKAMFAIGRILLSFNDETGISAIEKAVFLEPAMRRTADELIARYESRVNTESEEIDEALA